eukprot:m.211903 g.211903  ORF g.211903 m.211903 type:complete len:737 (-) comp15563_c1_seq17:118-2328(-)
MTAAVVMVLVFAVAGVFITVSRYPGSKSKKLKFDPQNANPDPDTFRHMLGLPQALPVPSLYNIKDGYFVQLTDLSRDFAPENEYAAFETEQDYDRAVEDARRPTTAAAGPAAAAAAVGPLAGAAAGPSAAAAASASAPSVASAGPRSSGTYGAARASSVDDRALSLVDGRHGAARAPDFDMLQQFFACFSSFSLLERAQRRVPEHGVVSTKQLVRQVTRFVDPRFLETLGTPLDTQVADTLWKGIEESAARLAAATSECGKRVQVDGGYANVQDNLFAITEYVLNRLGSRLFCCDTHAENAPRDAERTGTLHKIDLTLVDKDSPSAHPQARVLPQDIVSFMELKLDFQEGDDAVDSVFAQVLDRTEMIMSNQQHRRKIICCVADKIKIQFFLFSQESRWSCSPVYSFITTGKSPTEGFLHWVRFLNTMHSNLGFVSQSHPPVPQYLTSLGGVIRASFLRAGEGSKASLFEIEKVGEQLVCKHFPDKEEYIREKTVYCLLRDIATREKSDPTNFPFPHLHEFNDEHQLLIVKDYGTPVLQYLAEASEADFHQLFKTVVQQVARALCILHAHNLTHRDVSLGNILVVRRGERDVVVLNDFGSADFGTSPVVATTVPFAHPILHDAIDSRSPLPTFICAFDWASYVLVLTALCSRGIRFSSVHYSHVLSLFEDPSRKSFIIQQLIGLNSPYAVPLLFAETFRTGHDYLNLLCKVARLVLVEPSPAAGEPFIDQLARVIE